MEEDGIDHGQQHKHGSERSRNERDEAVRISVSIAHFSQGCCTHRIVMAVISFGN
jgi:hypothetical protein